MLQVVVCISNAKKRLEGLIVSLVQRRVLLKRGNCPKDGKYDECLSTMRYASELGFPVTTPKTGVKEMRQIVLPVALRPNSRFIPSYSRR
jgi:hypothetical protein